MYAPKNTRSDGGIVLAGLGYRGPTIEVDYPWRPDEVYPYAPAMENGGGGGGVLTEVEPAYGRPTVWPIFFDQPPPISGEAVKPRNWGLPYYYAPAPPAPTPAAPDVVSFNPQQGEVTVITEPGQPPRLVLNLPGVRVDTSRIGQPAAPPAEQTFEDLKNWLQNKTIFSSVPNWVVLLGGYFAFDALGKGGR